MDIFKVTTVPWQDRDSKADCTTCNWEDCQWKTFPFSSRSHCGKWTPLGALRVTEEISTKDMAESMIIPHRFKTTIPACDECGGDACHWKELLTKHQQSQRHCHCSNWHPAGTLKTLDEESQ